MMLRRRTVRVLAVVVLVLAAGALTAVLLLRRGRAPEAVRLLPEADAVVYFDVQALRTLGAFSGTAATREPEYEEFVRATGFQFERDLDAAAFAVHAAKMTPTPAPGGGPQLSAETRFSEVFIGRFDIARATAYLRKLAKGTERYRDIDVYFIPHENRQVKVAILGVDRVAVSNTDSREPLHRMIDRYRSGAMHAAGPAIVAAYREHIPLGSVIWAVARIGDESGNAGVPAPPALAVLSGTTLVGSVRPLLGAQLRLEDVAGDSVQAQRIVESCTTMLALFKDMEAGATPSGTDEDVKKVFDSIRIEQQEKSAVLTATIPPGFLKKITSEPPALTQAAPTAVPTPTPSPAPKKRVAK
ncbi:MAG: hypothetical protein M3P27_08255 [Acidobacteriota bacterium]|nr:hypothetical protein [Acidobacteriota bacterium]